MIYYDRLSVHQSMAIRFPPLSLVSSSPTLINHLEGRFNLNYHVAL